MLLIFDSDINKLVNNLNNYVLSALRLTLGKASWLSSSCRFLMILKTKVLQANGSHRIMERSLKRINIQIQYEFNNPIQQIPEWYVILFWGCVQKTRRLVINVCICCSQDTFLQPQLFPNYRRCYDVLYKGVLRKAAVFLSEDWIT